MDVTMLLLRVVHIFTGVFWAGTIFFLVSFLQPAVRAVGPDGGKVMLKLTQSRFASALPTIALLNVASGLIMYWRDSAGLRSIAWLASGNGLALTIGGLAGLAAFVVGLAITRPAVVGIAILGAAIQSAGGPPSPAQAAQLQKLQGRLAQGTMWIAVFLAVAVLGMASAQYLTL